MACLNLVDHQEGLPGRRGLRRHKLSQVHYFKTNTVRHRPSLTSAHLSSRTFSAIGADGRSDISRESIAPRATEFCRRRRRLVQGRTAVSLLFISGDAEFAATPQERHVNGSSSHPFGTSSAASSARTGSQQQIGRRGDEQLQRCDQGISQCCTGVCGNSTKGSLRTTAVELRKTSPTDLIAIRSSP